MSTDEKIMKETKNCIYHAIKHFRVDIDKSLDVGNMLLYLQECNIPPHIQNCLIECTKCMIDDGLLSEVKDKLILTEKGYNEIYEMGDNPEQKALDDTVKFIFEAIKNERIDIKDIVDVHRMVLNSNGQLYPHIYRSIEKAVAFLDENGLLQEVKDKLILTEKGYNEIYDMGDNPEQKALDDTVKFIFEAIKNERIDIDDIVDVHRMVLNSNGQLYPHIYRSIEKAVAFLDENGLLQEVKNKQILTEKGYKEVYNL